MSFSFPCNATEALLEVEVEELADWGLRQASSVPGFSDMK